MFSIDKSINLNAKKYKGAYCCIVCIPWYTLFDSCTTPACSLSLTLHIVYYQLGLIWGRKHEKIGTKQVPPAGRRSQAEGRSEAGLLRNAPWPPSARQAGATNGRTHSQGLHLRSIVIKRRGKLFSSFLRLPVEYLSRYSSVWQWLASRAGSEARPPAFPRSTALYWWRGTTARILVGLSLVRPSDRTTTTVHHQN